MKKILLFAVPVLFFAACSPKTEIAVKNASDSDGTISDVIWNDSNGAPAVTFATDASQGSQTESKETDVLNGGITCAVDNNDGNFFQADVTIAATGSDSASINEGESNVLTVNATATSTPASLRKK